MENKAKKSNNFPQMLIGMLHAMTLCCIFDHSFECMHRRMEFEMVLVIATTCATQKQRIQEACPLSSDDREE